MESLYQVLAFLSSIYIWDLTVLSQPWMYYPILIPAMCFVVFMFVQLVVVFSPVWILIYCIKYSLTAKFK
jgi:hypothetical protein